jgi:hypothetical protein
VKKAVLYPEKAYRNFEFLNSPGGRTIRMLAEFLEPQARFRSAGVRDTIVFFGSARIKPRAEARLQLKKIERSIKQANRSSKKLLALLQEAKVQYNMSRYYEETVELSRLLTSWSKTLRTPNRFVICSGGGPGIMEAANKGARLAHGKSIGMNISLPFEQFSNRYITPELSFEFHYFFMRKFWFMYLAKALVVFPGGFGTLDELMEVLTLLQTQKIKKKMSVVMYGSEYWKKVINFDEMVKHDVITVEDLKLFKMLDNPRDAFDYLRRSLMKDYPTT